MIAEASSITSATESDTMDTLKQTVSASRLNCWLQCRLKFFFRYVKQIRKPPTPSLHIGTTVHSVLQAWNMARWKKQPFDLARFKALFNEGWANQKARINWEEEESEKSGAWALLETYFQETPIKANEMPEGVEVSMETDLSQHGLPALIGVIDLVRAGGRIVDFKTSGKTPSPQDAIHQHELQLSCYSLLYREATGHNESGRELHYLIKTKTPKIIITQLEPMTQNQETRLFKMMESYVEGVGRADFVPSPGMGCMGCELFNECRAWS